MLRNGQNLRANLLQTCFEMDPGKSSTSKRWTQSRRD